jgi:Flp pilus assembly pilin Flp
MRISLRACTQVRDRSGQGLVEYGLILGLVTLIAIFTLLAPAGRVNALIQAVASSLSTVS